MPVVGPPHPQISNCGPKILFVQQLVEFLEMKPVDMKDQLNKYGKKNLGVTGPRSSNLVVQGSTVQPLTSRATS